MKEELAQVVFVDPPYNVRIEGHVSGNGKIRHREFAQGSGELKRDEFTLFLTNSCELLAKHTIDGAIHYVCMDWRHAAELLAAGEDVYSELKNIVVWVKNNPGDGIALPLSA
jgi:DNA modification methylase